MQTKPYVYMTYETSLSFAKEGGAKFFFSYLNFDSTFLLEKFMEHLDLICFLLF
jgi:hypothetical protein